MKKINFNLNKLIHFKINYIHNISFFLRNKKFHKYIQEHKYTIIFIALIILICRVGFSIYFFNFKYYSDKYTKSMNLLIISKEKETDSSISYLAKLENNGKYTDNFILNIYKDKKIVSQLDEELFYSNYSNFKYGDIVSIKGKIVIPKKLNNLHEFDYKKYLNSRNIVGSITTYDAKKVSKIKNNLLSYIYRFRDDLEYIIDNKFSKNEATLFKSMLYGDDSNLDEEIKNNFTKLGLSHLLAVSGSNVGVVTLILYYLFNKIKVNSYISFFITILVLFSFCVISGFEISLIRASIIAIIAMFAVISKIKFNKYFSLLLTLTIMLIYNPFCIFNVSFILSFTAFTGLLLFSQQIQSLFDVYITKVFGLSNVIKIKSKNCNFFITSLYKFIKSISNILSLYFSVQILILPVQIYFFHSFNLISILSNLIIYFISSMQLIFGYLFIFLNKIPFIVDVLAYINHIIIYAIIQIVNFLVGLNYIEIKLPTPDILSIFCYYIIVIYIFYGYKIVYYLKYKYKKVNVKFVFSILFTASFIYILYFNIYITYLYSFVYYFNVEQGNMAVIKNNRSVVVVDMGTTGKINLTNILQSFLEAYNIGKIDYFLVTHLHSDHINALFQLEDKLKNKEISVESVIYSIPKYGDKHEESSYTENSVSYLEFENYLSDMGIKQIKVEQLDSIQLSNNFLVDILSPKDKEIIKSKDIVNSNSIIALITAKDSNFLFMGDSTIESEKSMLEDIYKLENKEKYLNKLNNLRSIQIGHHGSNTSSSEYFIKNISTKLAVISSKKSVYGHPSLNVTNTLKKYNVKFQVTEQSGGILVKY